MANNDSFTQPNGIKTGDLLDRAQRYCATAEHCAADVRQLLQRIGATDRQIDEVIGILKEQNYLNEARYCHAFVHDKVAFQGWGRMKIIMGLRAKHLPDAAINEAMADIDESLYAANIRKLTAAKRGQDKQKITRFMLQRGYTFDDLRRYAKYENNGEDLNNEEYENYD